jgi:hypothetical protein
MLFDLAEALLRQPKVTAASSAHRRAGIFPARAVILEVDHYRMFAGSQRVAASDGGTLDAFL